MSKEPLYPHIPKSKGTAATPGIPRVVSNATAAKIHILKAMEEMELAGRILSPGDAQPVPYLTERVLDLFPRVDDLLEHIKEDLEDISEGRPFRHG